MRMKGRIRRGKEWFLRVVILVLALNSVCVAASENPTLVLGGFTTPREAYGKAIIPAFQSFWKTKTGQNVMFQESYLGSGAQARAIISGFEADVAALSLEGDIDKIAEAGLIKHNWKGNAKKGMVSRSIVVFAVRKGNPKAIHDWADLGKKGIQILTPNPKTSGGAMWNVNALYGAALRGQVKGVAKGDATAARQLLRNVFQNVTVMDKGARESITNFERGIGDVAITYENEVLVGRQAGQTYDYVVPRSTILIENPVAIVDKWAEKHKTRELGQAFVEFLWTPEAQRMFAKYGLRSIDPAVEQETAKFFPPVEDLWTIEYLGGWPAVSKNIFGPQGVYTQVMAELRR